MPKFKPNTSSFKMKGSPAKSNGGVKIFSKGYNVPWRGKDDKEKNTTKTTTTKTTKTKNKKAKDSSTKSGPDWPKAPKMNTQARRDWYTKHNLAQDKTTELKSTAPPRVEPKKVTEVEPRYKRGPKPAAIGAKVAKTKSRRELANERIAARRARRNAKLENFVSGLKPRSKAKK